VTYRELDEQPEQVLVWIATEIANARNALLRRGCSAPPARTARPLEPLDARPARHRGEDHQRVGGTDGRLETVEYADVLVVEVDVDVAVQCAV
jgi:hypothetical protein